MIRAWKLDSDRPIYTQILEVITIRIVSGQYAPGDRLPSVRELAAEAGVNPNTMQKALSELERSGLVTTQRTSGRTVTDDMEQVKQMRNHLAQTHVKEFIEKMEELGFHKEEIRRLFAEIDESHIDVVKEDGDE